MRIVTYNDLKKGIKVENDRYGMASFQYEMRRKAFLSNPSGYDDEDPYLFLTYDGIIPVGRMMLFKTRLKVGKEIVAAYSGSAFDVVESYRKDGLGGYMFWEVHNMRNRNPILSAAISDDAIILNRRLKYNIIECPKLLLLRDLTPLLGRIGIKKREAKLLSFIMNPILNFVYSIMNFNMIKLRNLDVRRLETIPEWVDSVVLNDGHKYTEVHDHLWFQWCLDNRFTSDNRDSQAFFAIYRQNEPQAFFMIKERYREEVKGLQDFILGTIVEWGIIQGSDLREIDLQYIATQYFSKNVAIIQTISNDIQTVKKLKRMGFIHRGDFRISFKDKSKRIYDASDKNLWRVRYGYADSILI